MGENKNNRRTRKPDFKTWIWVGCAAVALAAVVAVIISFNFREKYNSDYFHDTDNKFVVTTDYETSALENGPYEPFITHVVYYHNGNQITDAKAFYEYANANEAAEAFEKLNVGDYFDSKSLNDRFVVFQVKKAQYENTTLDDLKESRELLKDIDAVILDYNDKTLSEYGTWRAGITTDFDSDEEARPYTETVEDDEDTNEDDDEPVEIVIEKDEEDEDVKNSQ